MTVVWRAQWDTGEIQIKIERQGCRDCERKCHGSFSGNNDIGITIQYMMQWLWDTFYDEKKEKTVNESNKSDDDDDDAHEGPPHDIARCEAGRKGTCKKCKKIRERQRRK